MNPLNLDVVQNYVNENVGTFHDARIKSLRSLGLKDLLKKNLYMFRAKNILTASDMVNGFMDAFLSSSEEEQFGMFMEGLAIFVAQQTTDGYKSTSKGVDLEFVSEGVHHIVQIKSGPNWGNSSQQNQLQTDLKAAVSQAKQKNPERDVLAVLGICYGKTRTNFLRGYLKVVGQNFWYFISENTRLYTEIVEPVGYRAREHNERYLHSKAEAVNKLTREFLDDFCYPTGAIDWNKLVETTCGNYDLDRYCLPDSAIA